MVDRMRVSKIVKRSGLEVKDLMGLCSEFNIQIQNKSFVSAADGVYLQTLCLSHKVEIPASQEEDVVPKVLESLSEERVQYRNANYARQDFSGAIFKNSDFWQVNFGYADVSQADFSGCSIREAQLTRVHAVGTIFDDSNGNYIYISTDNGTYGYFKSISNFKKIVSYSYDTNQLNATWRSYTGSGITWTDLGDIESYNFIAYRGQTQAINYTGSIGSSFIPPTGFTNSSVTFEGAVLASKDGALSFRVDSGVGYNLFVNDTLQISNYNQSTTLSTLYSTNAFNATEGDVFKIKLHELI